jgi:hypothetical protein
VVVWPDVTQIKALTTSKQPRLLLVLNMFNRGIVEEVTVWQLKYVYRE